MKHNSNTKTTNSIIALCIISFLTGIHLSLPVYFNSGFLSNFIDERTISLVYSIISLVTILGLLAMHTILKKIGAFRTSIALILIQMTVFYYFINTNDINVILPLFIVAMSIVSLIVFANDIFIQESTEIHHTGRVRGLVMTASNAAWILGPLFAGILVSSTDSIENYKGIYIAAFAILLPLLYVVFKNFQYFKDPKYIEISTRETVIRILKNKDISKIFLANTVLQSFYAWMTVYVPIYLHQTIGFDWKEISIILTIMLIPFVLVDIPLGKLADKKWGEKELMITGFVILGVSTACLTLLGIKSLAAWATILFITRIGAATAEIMIETYFFKKIDGRDPEILSLFRITRPLAYFVAPVIATVALVYTTDQYLFVVFGLLALLTIYPISTIKDTN